MTGPATPVVEVTDAHVSLGGTEVLHGIDLRIDPGELVALLGANGSGKSTLLRTIVGVFPMDSGSATLMDMPVARSRAHDRMGYVPQDATDGGSIPATARETVATGLLGARTWRPRLRDPRVMRVLDAVGMADLADRPITRMSGGQRRRVMIARALVRDPEFLVLDEPFSGVDLPTQEVIAALFRDLSARGTTILVVLHEIGPLEGAIQRAVVLDHGLVVHDGPVGERPLLDPGHDHSHHATPIDECLGQELHPA
ncbi:zinc transport system ATP-binding protein [Brachybacterium muris]|uniref:ATP-binding cassette domain-containing protein n=1 Tax=Brachybacterium muris TaxID=219301 RepID=UPI00195CD3A6|nr:zinc transport system ATP-binding protein [Brachybacterium muris]